MTEVKVRLFGAFRKYENGSSTVLVKVPLPCTPAQLRMSLTSFFQAQRKDFSDEALLGKSVVADENHVFAEDEVIEQASSLALLPPVCGG
jgi:molybdopterin converting factor small subunit